MFDMLVLAGPSKVEGVVFGNNLVKNGRIHQEIKWNVPVLRYNTKPQYIIRYAEDSSKVFSDTEEQERGDYSNIVSIAYTSEFIV